MLWRHPVRVNAGCRDDLGDAAHQMKEMVLTSAHSAPEIAAQAMLAPAPAGGAVAGTRRCRYAAIGFLIGLETDQ